MDLTLLTDRRADGWEDMWVSGRTGQVCRGSTRWRLCHCNDDPTETNVSDIKLNISRLFKTLIIKYNSDDQITNFDLFYEYTN